MKHRHDLVIFDSHRAPIRIIEVKKRPRPVGQHRKQQAAIHTAQLVAYSFTGVDIDVVRGMPQAEKYVKACEEAYPQLPDAHHPAGTIGSVPTNRHSMKQTPCALLP